MKKVKSSNIAAVGYDAETQVLTVQFVSGQTHNYLKVPAKTHESLMAAKSVGSYFHTHIRSKFKGEKVDA